MKRKILIAVALIFIFAVCIRAEPPPNQTRGWVNYPVNLDDINDVDTSGAQNSQALTYDAVNTTWKPAAGGGTDALADLSDVNLSGIEDNDLFAYDAATSTWGKISAVAVSVYQQDEEANIPSGTYTKPAFGVVVYDPEGCWDATDKRFECAQTGWYLAIFHCGLKEVAGTDVFIHVTSSGSVNGDFRDKVKPDSSVPVLEAIGFFYLDDVGDYIAAEIYPYSSGVDIENNAWATNFTVLRLF